MHDHYTAHTNARGNQPIYLSVALVLILLITLFGPTPSLGAESSTPPNHSSLPGSFADLVERVKPAVVTIRTKAGSSLDGGTQPNPERAPQTRPNQPFPDGGPNSDRFNEFFERFFDREFNRPAPLPGLPNQRRSRRSLGSGFIIGGEGHIVTNHHVIEDASEIEVILEDGSSLSAVLVGQDPKTDLALLKVETEKPLPSVPFGDSDHSRVGDWVIAIGNPFGLGGTATTGIISARGRDIRSGPLDDFIQIDAAINRGNSGGPLFNLNGEVIGVNSAIYSPNGGNVGIGFAIPSTLALNVIDQLKEKGSVARGWLGVQIQTVSAELAEAMGLENPRGALIADVVADSPAFRGGLQVGDIILKYGDTSIKKMGELPRLVALSNPSETTLIVVWRNGKEVELRVAVQSVTDKQTINKTPGGDSSSEKWLGLHLRSIDHQNPQQRELNKAEGGVLVAGVDPGSQAARSGVREGDIILQAGSSAVDHPETVARAITEAERKGRQSVVILVKRNDRALFIAIPLS